MLASDYRRFKAIHHLVVASGYETLQASLRALELSLPELMEVLHQIEWDNGDRLFTTENGILHFTEIGSQQLTTWRHAVQSLGIAV